MSTGAVPEAADQRNGLQGHPIVCHATEKGWCDWHVIQSKGSSWVGPITQRVRRGLQPLLLAGGSEAVGAVVGDMLVCLYMHIPC